MSYLEAVYEDGYIHSEKSLSDQSPYEADANVFSDILNKRPEADHGRLVELALFHDGSRYSVDWTKLPDNARPVRFKHMQAHFNQVTGPSEPELVGIDFGYQFTDNNGNNVQKILSL
jgi:hypothetical protein